MSSAYGPARPRLVRPTLPSTVWKCSTDSEKNHISVHHLTIDTARTLPGLIPFLADAFALEINTGRTYPQEEDIFIGTGSGTSTEVVPAFEAYFFAGDVFIGVFDKVPASTVEGDMIAGGLNELCPDHNWEDCIAGFFYIKPNYPGRSSHICNAGFIVPVSARGYRVGSALGRSYLHYGPLLDYKASVFNLVYSNNIASVKIWERLGFTKAGVIPKAGRLRKSGKSDEEEYVDAWIYYKEF